MSFTCNTLVHTPTEIKKTQNFVIPNQFSRNIGVSFGLSIHIKEMSGLSNKRTTKVNPDKVMCTKAHIHTHSRKI